MKKRISMMKNVMRVIAVGSMISHGCQAEPEEPRPEGPTQDQALEETSSVTARLLGMVVNNTTGSATVFDANTSTIFGTVQVLGGHSTSGDCSITPDGTKGFFTNYRSSITVADLTTTPPSQAGTPNPIPISNPGLDTAISPDGRFLLVCDGRAAAPISVIDVATQRQVSTFQLDTYCTSVDICSDGSVLATSADRVRRLALSSAGVLTDTRESLLITAPGNVYCAPAATAGIVLASSTITSFRIPGLAQVSPRTLPDELAAAFNHAGNRVYLRSSSGVTGSLSGYTFDQATGALGAAPLFQVAVTPAGTFFGIDQLAVHPSDASRYVPEAATLRIRDAATGAVTGSIVVGTPSTTQLTGVCFSANRPPWRGARTAPSRPMTRAMGRPASTTDRPIPTVIRSTARNPRAVPTDGGTTAATLTCTDSHGARTSCTANVTVVDQTPPTVIAADAGSLWPPDHDYRRIDLGACITSIRDACDGPLDIASHATATCCTSDEPDAGLGAGDRTDDCVIVDRDSLDVRAERSGTGNGRVYTVHYTVTDSSNNAGTHTCTVTVPHSQNGSPAIDDGPQTTCR